MGKTIYVVSYTSSHYDEIYNNVIAFDKIENAIDSANSYLADAKKEMRKDFVLEQNFNHYKGGYQEIEVNDHYGSTTFLISISKFNFAQ